MLLLEQSPPSLAIPLREEPPGVLRVGKIRVLLDLVIRAYQRGASPQDIVRMYDALDLDEVFAVIAYYLAHPAGIDATRRKIEAAQPFRPDKDELLARARAKGPTS